jgi:phage terminase large subunit-like protein
VHNLILCGRAKKNWKTADLDLACFYALLDDSAHGNEVYIVANDEGQAADDLSLCKKLVRVNPVLEDFVKIKANIIERKDGNGFIEILPAQDAVGAHGKTYRLLGVDEIHGHKTWDLLEALAPDPTRPDCQQWITSYASLFHKPGVPLYDLMQIGKAGLH